MSYILDALKKLEHEKSRKPRGDGMINITGALFEHERPKPSGTAGRKIALAVTVAVLVTFGATWLLLQSGKGRGNPAAPRIATTAPQITVETAPAAPAARPVVSVQQMPAAAPPAPAPLTPARPPAHPSKLQTAVVPSASATEDADDELTSRELRKRQREQKRQTAPADQAVTAPADIKLSGIAWQEERRARRAVVNGFLMREGGVVSGARITDIYQDRVRFSQSDKTFEIPLTSSVVPAAVK